MSLSRLLAVAFTIAGLAPASALDLPQTAIAYEIEVRLDPSTRELVGSERIRWTHPGQSAIERIPLHLYLNGFAHEDTTWMRSKPGFTDLEQIEALYDDPWGWIEPTGIRQDDIELEWRPIAPDDGNTLDRSLIEVMLAKPLSPGDSVTLEIDFDARLPFPMARTGGWEDFFLVAQWFPKVAVFETAGVRGAIGDRWAAHQFHGPTEFYADFADFDVRIGVPSGWPVAATGKGELELKGSAEELDWHRFRQRAVHDFAFATGERMVEVSSTHPRFGDGAPIEIRFLVPRGTEDQAARWREALVGGLDVLESRIGPYPYGTLTVVLPPWRAWDTSGMEYPTFFTGAPGDPFWELDWIASVRLSEGTITHELAHQYFYGVVGSNEFEDAYLDEGFTEFWGYEALIGIYGNEGGGGTLFGLGVDVTDFERAGLGAIGERFHPVRSGPSFVSRHRGKFAEFYSIPAATLRTVSNVFGRQTIDRVFSLYYQRWAFRHPAFEDFLETARDAAGDTVADFILEAFTQDRLPDYRVASVTTEPWQRPAGRVVTVDGQVIEPDAAETEDIELAGLDDAALELDGLVLAEVLDPGWVRGEDRVAGGIERRRLSPELEASDPEWENDPHTFHVSSVRVEGAGWDRLPVELLFRFADGAVVSDTWDGRSSYREYRFVRAAPISKVLLDPDGKIALDPDLANNGWLEQGDDRLAQDWSLWLGGLFQLLLEGASQWL